MKKLTAEDLFALQYGDKVYRHNGNGNFTEYQYVGRIPSNPERFLIFSSGLNLINLYINKDNNFYYDWYSGDFDPKFAANIEIDTIVNRLTYLKSLINEK